MVTSYQSGDHVVKKCKCCKKKIDVNPVWNTVTCPHCNTKYHITHRLNPKCQHHHGGISLYIPPIPRQPAKELVVEYVDKFPGCTVAEISKEINYSVRCVRYAVQELSDYFEIKKGSKDCWHVYRRKCVDDGGA